MNFAKARKEWEAVRDRLDEATTQAHRVANDRLPINAEDVTTMQARLAEVQAVLERLLRGLS